MMRRTLHIALISFCAALASCKKMLDVPSPSIRPTSDAVFADDAMAASVLTGIYSQLSQSDQSLAGTTLNNLSLVGGLTADELTLMGGTANGNQNLRQYYFNRVLPGEQNSTTPSPWNVCYQHIYVVNLALEKLAASTALTPLVKTQLEGEAYFIRAFNYSYLTQLYGDVPLVTSSDYRSSRTAVRASVVTVQTQITADLVKAQELLSDAYRAGNILNSSMERLRPNKGAATALLARHYLILKNWTGAEAEASKLIGNTAIYDTMSLNNTFKKESREAIWQLQPVVTGWNTGEARFWILPPTGPTSNSSSGGWPVYLNASLLTAFEPGDQRKDKWVGSVVSNGITYYYPYKYKSATLNAPVTEYSMVLRLAEQYLIRAEARAHQNKVAEAQDDLNLIRRRAGLANTTASTKENLLAAILQERQTELFTEWGHRWLDLKRTGKIDAVMNTVAPTKPTTWSTNWQWWPLPAYELFQNPNLVQNTGY